MAALGADVTHCEVLSTPPPPPAARLHGAKRVAADPQAALALRPDVVLADGAWERGDDPHGLGGAALLEAASVLTWVTPYGRQAPGARASEFTLQADAGIVELTGHADGPGVRAGFALGSAMAACMATTVTAAALSARERGRPHPRELDVAIFDALYSSLTTQLPARWLGDDGPPRAGNRHPMAAPWNTYLCADGWVSVCTMSDRQWRALCDLIEQPAWLEDEQLATAGGRLGRADELDATIERWTRPQTVAEALEALRAVGVACGPIRSLAEARRNAALPLDAPGVPAPVWFSPGVPPTTPASDGDADPAAGPLAGLRILEAGAYTSGPVAARLLAGLGATVTKVEPPQGDPCRRLASQVDGTAYLFHINNTDKRSLVLESAEDAEPLLRETDVVLANLSAPTLEAIGLDAEHAAPGLLHCVVTGFDRRSPDQGLLAFDTVVQAMCGMLDLTGEPDAAPVRSGVSAIDFTGALMTATQIASWWLWRTRGGPGGRLEVPLHEVGVWTCSDAWDRPAEAPARYGNDDPNALVQDLFATADGEVAVTVDYDRDLERLRALLPEIPPDAEGAHAALREWCAARESAAVLAALGEAGLAAAQATGIARMADHPQAHAREVLAVADPASAVPLLLGYPWWLDGEPSSIRTLAPPSPGAGAGAAWTAARARRTR
ncbi:MAG TPA: CoA transferase [Solirubrobacterales bacterium]|nr:CoA transferase [Solirubrobacterales bacterium]